MVGCQGHLATVTHCYTSSSGVLPLDFTKTNDSFLFMMRNENRRRKPNPSKPPSDGRKKTAGERRIMTFKLNFLGPRCLNIGMETTIPFETDYVVGVTRVAAQPCWRRHFVAWGGDDDAIVGEIVQVLIQHTIMKWRRLAHAPTTTLRQKQASDLAHGVRPIALRYMYRYCRILEQPK